MISDLFFTHRGDSRPWTLMACLFLFVVVGLTGCATTNGSIVKMARQDVVGPVASVEKTTETTTNKDGSTTVKVTEKSIQMTASAADFRLKELGIKKVAEVGVERAKASVFTYGNSYGSQYGNYGYDGVVQRGTFITSQSPSGSNIVVNPRK